MTYVSTTTITIFAHIGEDDWLRIEAEHQYASTLMLQRKFTEALHHQQKVVEAAEDKFKDQIVSGTIALISTNDATCQSFLPVSKATCGSQPDFFDVFLAIQ